MVPKTRAYVKGYDGKNNQMYFLVEDHDFLEKCSTIWGIFSTVYKKTCSQKKKKDQNQNQILWL